jgi:TM2 domain-containing membrane protein YozV
MELIILIFLFLFFYGYYWSLKENFTNNNNVNLPFDTTIS